MGKPVEKFHTIDEITSGNPDNPFTKIIVSGDEILSVNPQSKWRIERIFTDYCFDHKPHETLIVEFKRKEKDEEAADDGT